MSQSIHPYARRFGQRLRALFDSVGMASDTEVGKLVADAQHAPPRDGVPYDPAVIAAWCSGALLPTPEAFTAISELCHTRGNHAQCDALEQAYDAALGEPHSRHISEVSVTLQARVKATGLTLDQMAMALADQGTPLSDSSASARVMLHTDYAGKRSLSPERLAAYDKVLSRLGIDGPPLVALDALERMERSNVAYAPPSVPEGSLGSMLKACRLRLGLSMHRMAEAIASITGKPISHMAVYGWENGTLPSRDSFPMTDPITVYGTLLSAAETRAGEIEPWWTPAREQEMRTAHAQAIATAHDHHTTGWPLSPAYSQR